MVQVVVTLLEETSPDPDSSGARFATAVEFTEGLEVPVVAMVLYRTAVALDPDVVARDLQWSRDVSRDAD